MNKKLLELLGLINQSKATIENLVSEDKMDEAKAEKENLKALQEKFDMLKDVLEAGPANAIPAAPAVPAGAQDVSGMAEMANAIRSDFKNLMKEGVGADGGYTVPEDVQTKINHYKENNRSLRELVDVIPVTTNKGSRVYQTKTTAPGFQQVAEDGSVQIIGDPKYTQLTWAIKDFGGAIPVTKDLLADSDANIESEIVKWMGKNTLVTDNTQILAKFKTLAYSTAITNYKTLAKAIGSIDSAYDIKVVTNDTGALFLGLLEDGQNRPIFTPVPTDPAKKQIAIGVNVYPVEIYPNSALPNESDGKVPFIIGDGKEAVKLFDRQETTLSSFDQAVLTNTEGEIVYNAAQQRGKVVLGAMRADYVVSDNAAVIYAKATMPA